MSQIRMFLFRPGGSNFEIPVIPEKISIDDGTSSTRKVVLGIGTMGFPGYRNPKKISWSSFFPYQYDSVYCQYANLLHPQAAVDFFIKSMAGTKNPNVPDIMHVKVTDEYEEGLIWPVIDDFFTINDFSPSMEAGELSDVHYSITLETIRVPSLRVTDATADNIPAELRKAPPKPASDRSGPGATSGGQTTYTVQSGDSLSAIAGKLLGDMGRWSDIYNLNKTTIGPDPDLIQVGQVLTIPSVSSSGGSGGNRNE